MPIKVGDSKTHSFVVEEKDFARFENGLVHPVCSTFKLVKEAEWAGRLLLLDLITDDEEGIGTSVSITHVAPAYEGQLVEITATVRTLAKNLLICSFTALADGVIIAKGETGQKVLNKARLMDLYRQKKAASD